MIHHPPFDDLSPELLALARAPLGAPPTREIARVHDEVITGVPVRVYEHDQAPTGLVVGSGNGSLRSGRHIDYGKDTPVTNLLLAMLDRVGVRPGRLGDSTGPLEI